LAGGGVGTALETERLGFFDPARGYIMNSYIKAVLGTVCVLSMVSVSSTANASWKTLWGLLGRSSKTAETASLAKPGQVACRTATGATSGASQLRILATPGLTGSGPAGAGFGTSVEVVSQAGITIGAAVRGVPAPPRPTQFLFSRTEFIVGPAGGALQAMNRSAKGWTSLAHSDDAAKVIGDLAPAGQTLKAEAVVYKTGPEDFRFVSGTLVAADAENVVIRVAPNPGAAGFPKTSREGFDVLIPRAQWQTTFIWLKPGS
jgi:hypothetical protein